MKEEPRQNSVPSRGPSATVQADRGPEIILAKHVWNPHQWKSRANQFGKRFAKPIGITIIAIAASFGAILLMLGPVANWIAGESLGALAGKDRFAALNGIRQTIVAAMVGIAGAVGLAFTVRTYSLSKRAQEIDRFTKAVSLLSSDKQSERVGGLLTIEYVIREKITEARAAVEVVSSFIRERAHVSTDQRASLRQAEPSWGDPDVQIEDDVHTALLIIGTNFPRPQRHMLDLSRTDLRGAALAGTNFSYMKFFSCLMQGVSFVGADLKYCRLDGSMMVGAWLERADLRQTTLRRVDLRGANLEHAQVDASQLLPAIIDESTRLDSNVREALEVLRKKGRAAN